MVVGRTARRLYCIGVVLGFAVATATTSYSHYNPVKVANADCDAITVTRPVQDAQGYFELFLNGVSVKRETLTYGTSRVEWPSSALVPGVNYYVVKVRYLGRDYEVPGRFDCGNEPVPTTAAPTSSRVPTSCPTATSTSRMPVVWPSATRTRTRVPTLVLQGETPTNMPTLDPVEELTSTATHSVTPAPTLPAVEVLPTPAFEVVPAKPVPKRPTVARVPTGEPAELSPVSMWRLSATLIRLIHGADIDELKALSSRVLDELQMLRDQLDVVAAAIAEIESQSPDGLLRDILADLREVDEWLQRMTDQADHLRDLTDEAVYESPRIEEYAGALHSESQVVSERLLYAGDRASRIPGGVSFGREGLLSDLQKLQSASESIEADAGRMQEIASAIRSTAARWAEPVGTEVLAGLLVVGIIGACSFAAGRISDRRRRST